MRISLARHIRSITWWVLVCLALTGAAPALAAPPARGTSTVHQSTHQRRGTHGTRYGWHDWWKRECGGCGGKHCVCE